MRGAQLLVGYSRTGSGFTGVYMQQGEPIQAPTAQRMVAVGQGINFPASQTISPAVSHGAIHTWAPRSGFNSDYQLWELSLRRALQAYKVDMKSIDFDRPDEQSIPQRHRTQTVMAQLRMAQSQYGAINTLAQGRTSRPSSCRATHKKPRFGVHHTHHGAVPLR